MALHDDVALQALGSGVFETEIVDRYWIVVGPNGGYLAALVASAGDTHVADSARQLRSLTIHYLLPPKLGKVRINVQAVRSGKSVDFLRFEMLQDDKPVLVATGVWALSSKAIEGPTLIMPEVPSPGLCLPGVRLTEKPTRLHEQWEIRSVDTLETNTQTPDLTWWIRPAKETPMSSSLVVAIADALPPPIFVLSPDLKSVPTIDLTVHIRTDLASVNWDSDSWVLVHFTTTHVSGGFLEEDGYIWHQNGTLLGMSRQLALAR
ncbi:MAG: hypothetical protein CL455_08470 [Acidimicrobiaceae bacterium]|nr:hypothetical protein [Acidimicrobiaceae bacterium]MEC7845247.1 thioesterase family protein [Actinomycetota bacterium]